MDFDVCNRCRSAYTEWFPCRSLCRERTIAAKTWFGRLTISASGQLKANAKHYHAANKKRNS
jgi:hypothetical protein